ncbi:MULTISPECIES: RES family NAD+ phosphorylase [unclassified Caballeronia]|uniref:RES family NAD+ phosphorylase n=1 Tax=unclassified Caballeronia TaxID=2646786 RepID=UPI00285C3B0B|nr:MULTISPECIES: RES family NAD+ phosphorylase [unclassified Caballeronia]MDR5755160.1 RES family NAD+ phosphorylase [Caballeronia sp. LZ024]MDR5845366.1 RES family NAD+ phosphorylase [Caballeronia sp. LZ031]
MTVIAWRVVTERYADSAFSGEGARLHGGRWNPKGVAIVYTAQTQSLALLEMLVQDSPLRARYVMIPARIPETIVERVDSASLPRDWRDFGARDELQRIGAMWAQNQTSAVLAVPSAVVPAETNYLINLNHPDFAHIETGARDEWETDPRSLRRAAASDS